MSKGRYAEKFKQEAARQVADRVMGDIRDTI